MGGTFMSITIQEINRAYDSWRSLVEKTGHVTGIMGELLEIQEILIRVRNEIIESKSRI